jgi:hypothetical protein
VASVLAPPAERAGMTTPDSGGSGNGREWTIRNHETRLSRVEERLDNAKLDVLLERVTNLQNEAAGIKQDVKALNEKQEKFGRTMNAAALTLLTSGIIVAIGAYVINTGGT